MSKTTASKGIAALDTPPKPKASMDVHVPKECKAEIKGFKDISVDDDATIVIKGRVSEIRDRSEQWDSGKHICMEPSSVKIYGPDKKVTMDDAIEKAKKKV